MVMPSIGSTLFTDLMDVVLEAGFEPATSTLSRWHSTAELLEHEIGGEHRSRTESGIAERTT